jgi:hypothetical protein
VRLTEIGGLEVQDVDTQEMTINIRFNVTPRLKNDQSVRTVPVVDERAIEALHCWQRLTDTVFSRKRGAAEKVWRILLLAK